ncbi:transposase [Parvularcula flava]|uniref:Transposase n=2 Tax=Aquisalinus luteolus TaxID=1566827 RepID=A0ABX0HMC7_9PROT|nr:RNA-guided endonuclease TnpB family protein [Aquisalinus luteolus]NHK29178.1 transposase [Aquisalinus luteolus]
MSYITYKYRIKDATSGKWLDRHATACNQVWNFCCNTQRQAELRRYGDRGHFWPSAFDLINLTAGSGKMLGLHSDTVSALCRRFEQNRDTQERSPQFRKSFGPRRSLGWVPITKRALKICGDEVVYLKRRFKLWRSRDISGEFKAGSFTQDARGRWYVSLVCKVEDGLARKDGCVGIDLGLRNLAITSDAEKISAPRLFRRYERKLGDAQRAGNKRRARAIHAKIANARRDYLHKESTRLADNYSFIAVGDVKAAQLARTRMAKSIMDAGWALFRDMLRYKAARRRAVYVDVDERYTSQMCSGCGVVPDSSPKGMGALGMRRWDCCECGASHDRDVNAAKNILRAGLECQPPAEEILAA